MQIKLIPRRVVDLADTARTEAILLRGPTGGEERSLEVAAG